MAIAAINNGHRPVNSQPGVTIIAKKNTTGKATEAIIEANRCLFCYDAPCIKACPTGIDIPRFIKKIATGNIRGSAKVIFEANMLGLSTARVCPVDVLCVGACVYNDLNHTPIQIGRLQRYATERALVQEHAANWNLFTPEPARDRKVALIGAGPASLACAAYLALETISPERVCAIEAKHRTVKKSLSHSQFRGNSKFT